MVLIGAQIIGLVAVAAALFLSNRWPKHRALWVAGMVVLLLVGAADFITGTLGLVVLLLIGFLFAVFRGSTLQQSSFLTAVVAVLGFFGIFQFDRFRRGWFEIPSTQDARLYGTWVAAGGLDRIPKNSAQGTSQKIVITPTRFLIWGFYAGRPWGTSGDNLNVFGIHTDNAHLDRFAYSLKETPMGVVLRLGGPYLSPLVAYKRVGNAED